MIKSRCFHRVSYVTFYYEKTGRICFCLEDQLTRSASKGLNLKDVDLEIQSVDLGRKAHSSSF